MLSVRLSVRLSHMRITSLIESLYHEWLYRQVGATSHWGGLRLTLRKWEVPPPTWEGGGSASDSKEVGGATSHLGGGGSASDSKEVGGATSHLGGGGLRLTLRKWEVPPPTWEGGGLRLTLR